MAGPAFQENPITLMKKSAHLLAVAIMLIVFCSCGGKKKSYDELASSGLTTRTENMKENIKAYAAKGTIVGQMYGTIQGIGWQCDSDRSDIHSVCGDRPAAVGYELSGIERGSKTNADGLDFAAIRRDVLQNFRRGALITMQWTAPDYKGDDDLLAQYVKRLADYLGTLHDEYGIKAPVVLYLYPLTGNTWYDRLPGDAYTNLYKKTQDLLDDADVTNIVYGYAESYPSPQFLTRYPDNNIDVVCAMCLQSFGAPSQDYGHLLGEMVGKAQPFAQEHNNALGVVVGQESLPDSTFFSQTLLPLLQQHRLSYLMFGANRGDFKDGHYCTPFPGDGNSRIQDFMLLYNSENTLFMRRLNGLYLEH